MNFTPFGKGLHISITDLQDEMNRMFDRMWHGGISTAPLDGQQWAPSIDLVDEPAQFVLTAEVPGLEVDQIEVRYEDEEVIITGSKLPDRDENDDIHLVRRERRFGQFCRRVPLPGPINPAAIKASCRKGLLEVLIPKKEATRRNTVRIDVVEDAGA